MAQAIEYVKEKLATYQKPKKKPRIDDHNILLWHMKQTICKATLTRTNMFRRIKLIKFVTSNTYPTINLSGYCYETHTHTHIKRFFSEPQQPTNAIRRNNYVILTRYTQDKYEIADKEVFL